MAPLCRVVVGWDPAKAAHQELRQRTGTGVRQAGSLPWSEPAVLDIQQGEWECQGVLMMPLPSAAFPVSVLPDSLHPGDPTVFLPLFQGFYCDLQ